MVKQPLVVEPAQQYITKAAFAALYDATHRDVYRYVYGLTSGGQQEAEDITAETFLKAWDARRRFKGNRQQALSWLFTIAKRIVIDRWRKNKVRPDKISIDEIALKAVDATPEEQTALLEQSQQLVELLGDLADDKREMIVLRYLLNWPVNRIAEHTGKRPNTVSVALRRILEDLRQRWIASEGGTHE